MDWQKTWAAKLATPKDAIAAIAPGRRILIGSGAAEPVTLVEALVEHGGHLADNEIVHLLTLGPAPYVRPEHAARFRHTAFFIGANVREAVQDGRADFLPVFLSEIPELLRSRRVRVDVALIQVSPPDAHGFVSLGTSVDIVRAAVDTASLVLAEVNPRMPRTHGDSFIHASRLQRMVPIDSPLLELAAEAPGEVEREIGRLVATLVPHGATLQVGIGKIPDAVLDALGDKLELGVHTEMMADGVMKLVQAGVVTGRKKSLLPGKLVTSFVMGSRALYDWVHENPAVEMRASDFTNDPWVIARHERMVSINSALAVDLTGQVASDTLLGRFFSGIGGQVDFVRGAARSRAGKSILALPSTAKDGQVSRIRASFEEGAGVVTSRGDVRFVVTEFGIADLWGKSVRERATALTAVAHPSFRGDLVAAASQRRYVLPGQVVPRAVYPWREERAATLPEGSEVCLRPLRAGDEAGFRRLVREVGGDDERFQGRFLDDLQALADLDDERAMAMVACMSTSGELVAAGRYDVDPATRLAAVVVAVAPGWQGHGIGSALFRRMVEIATARGLAGFSAEVAATNKRMLALFYESGLRFEGKQTEGVYRLEARF